MQALPGVRACFVQRFQVRAARAEASGAYLAFEVQCLPPVGTDQEPVAELAADDFFVSWSSVGNHEIER